MKTAVVYEDIPQALIDVINKIAWGRFSASEVQQKLNELSTFIAQKAPMLKARTGESPTRTKTVKIAEAVPDVALQFINRYDCSPMLVRMGIGAVKKPINDFLKKNNYF